MTSVSGHTTVHLLRHGEVENPQGVLYGRLPGYFLSDLGLKMAGACWFLSWGYLGPVGFCFGVTMGGQLL